MAPRRIALARLAALGLLGALLAASAPSWPDDWDGIGFLHAATRFDLDRFSPHAPGYPVYVVLLRVAALGLSPLHATQAVSIVSALVTVLVGSDAAARVWGERAREPAALALVAPSLAWRCMSATGTESLALALAAVAAWAAIACRRRARHAWIALGLAVGLGLGVRLSWAPLYGSVLWLAGRDRAKSGAAALIACASWAIPLAILVGPAHLLRLYAAHAEGHATRWGGTAITRPGTARLWFLARDVLVDGLGVGTDGIGIAIGAATFVLGALGLVAWRSRGFASLRIVAILVLPYALWIAVGQNVAQQPRHALPLVVAMTIGLLRAAMLDRRTALLGAMLLALVATRTLRDTVDRATIAPPGAQLLARVRAEPAPTSFAVFGGPSARFFEDTELADRAASVGSLGDARLRMTRMRNPPARVLVTSEVHDLDGPEIVLRPFATLCRPPRLDRRAACLEVFEWAAAR